jgi:hypothetical protein
MKVKLLSNGTVNLIQSTYSILDFKQVVEELALNSNISLSKAKVLMQNLEM